MSDKRWIAIGKNSILIALTLCLLGFFSLANASLNRSYASVEGQTSNPEQSSVAFLVSYQELDEDQDSETYGQYIEKAEEYTTFPEAFAGAKVAYDRLNPQEQIQGEDQVQIPTICLQQDVTLTESFVAGEGDVMDVTLDMNGHSLLPEKGVSLDFGGCNVLLTDAVAEEGCAGTTQLPGGIQGEADYLLKGTGKFTFSAGYYRNGTGAIVGQAIDVVFENGYFITPGGYTVSEADNIFVQGGFFHYQETAGLAQIGNVTLLEEMAFAKTTIPLGDIEVTGYSLTGPGYKLVVHCLEGDSAGDRIYYYKKFDECWEQALNYSLQNDGATSEIVIYDTKITGVGLSHTYQMSGTADGEGINPVIKLTGISFQRADDFGDGFFDVKGGTLILSDCTLDGTLGEKQTSTGAAIQVTGDGVLQLEGATEAGTAIEKNNCGEVTTGTAGAGIYMGTGTVLKLQGNVTVKNNTMYTAATEDAEAFTRPCNVYMAEGAQVLLLNTLTSPERSIGFTYPGQVEAGTTQLGSLDDSFLQELIAEAGSAEAVEMDSSAAAIFMDGVASYFISFVPTQNQLLWDRNVQYLPEAGRLRLEYILLIMGLIGFIVRNVGRVKARVEVERYITILSLACLVLGAGIGFYGVRQESLRVEQNMQVMESMAGTPVIQETEEQRDEAPEQEEDQSPKEPSLIPSDGREYYGVVEIPELQIKLPVLATYTDADMKTTPCVYYGCRENNDLVIVGHNYASQFGTLNDVSQDLLVYLHMPDGSVYKYKSVATESLNPDQVDEMLMGDWDLTLFTCSYSGEKRIAVRCVLER